MAVNSVSRVRLNEYRVKDVQNAYTRHVLCVNNFYVCFFS